jgi:RNA polymerase-binding transcription factor DksA
VTPTAPAEVHAHLTRIETARQKQLHALPSTNLDTVAAAYRGTLERILTEVRTALFRLNDGSYGTCAGCQRGIPLARLELRPWATTCADCASRSRS